MIIVSVILNTRGHCAIILEYRKILWIKKLHVRDDYFIIFHHVNYLVSDGSIDYFRYTTVIDFDKLIKYCRSADYADQPIGSK